MDRLVQGSCAQRTDRIIVMSIREHGFAAWISRWHFVLASHIVALLYAWVRVVARDRLFGPIDCWKTASPAECENTQHPRNANNQKRTPLQLLAFS
jgi:hypothetical protein